jgi:Icc-related predicted phosphoesterase
MFVRTGLLISVLLAGALLAAAQSVPQNPPPSPSGKIDASKPIELKVDVPSSFMFIAMGDLRETQVSNHSASDPERRQAIIHAIADANPAFVGVSGDLVYNGGNEADWQQWDRETSEWTDKKLTVIPAPGNHDVRGDPLLEKYFRRFPALRQNRYYSVHAGNVLVLSLDSSLPTAAGPQFEWMKEKVEHLSKDSEFVVFLLHHPPMTRSEDHLLGGGHSARPGEIALATWLEDTQKRSAAKFVVIAGHVHNYERYERNNVTYIVSGGAGATPYMIERAAEDVYKDPGASYHYLKIRVGPGKMRIGMEKLEMVEGHPVWNERDSVSLAGMGAAAGAKIGVGVPK